MPHCMSTTTAPPATTARLATIARLSTTARLATTACMSSHNCMFIYDFLYIPQSPADGPISEKTLEKMEREELEEMKLKISQQ